MKNKNKSFDLFEYFAKVVLEADEDQQQNPADPPQQQPEQIQSSQNTAPEAFRSLQGQTVAGVQYSPNGSNGGSIKIKVKNSYLPFTISWVNQQVTVTTLTGETIVLSGG